MDKWNINAAMEQARKTGISITCEQDRHGSCFGCRCDCHEEQIINRSIARMPVSSRPVELDDLEEW